jgi:YYY domain-containing protein
VEQSWLSESIRWYLLLVAITWGLAPVARWMFGRLPDRGASVARPLALLCAIWPVWFLSSISPAPFTSLLLGLSFAVMSGASWFLAWRAGWLTRDWLTQIVVVEVIACAAFMAFVLLRGYTPEIIWTEKPMDIAFLSSSARATDMPPADPWYSGESINYYYLGYLLHGTLARLSGVPTWIAFNLALATTASMAIVAAGGAAFNITRRLVSKRTALAAALLAGFLLVLAGNLHAPVEVLRKGSDALDQSWWGPIGWDSSRIVVDHGDDPSTDQDDQTTINEFPWFSLLLGDLHPHLTALPFTILALVVALSLLSGNRSASLTSREIAQLVMCGAVVGALYPLNSLDFPTYLVMVFGALLLNRGLTQILLIEGAIVVVAALVVWLPFWVTFVPFAGTDDSALPTWLRDVPVVSRIFMLLQWHHGERTSVEEFLTVFGFFWVAAIAWLGWHLIEATRGRIADPKVTRWLIAGALLLAVIAVASQSPVLLLAGLPLAGALWLLSAACGSPFKASTAVTGLFAAGLGLIVATEFFYVQDVFSGRYNTLFKIYYQVWTMLAIGSAVAVVFVVRALRTRMATQGVMVALLAAGLLAVATYPIVATTQWTRVQGAREWKGLNGLAFLEAQAPGDVAAIQWLADNAREDDVIIEAPGCSYQVNGGMPTGRMAAFTGVPDIMGWQGHESQWRAGQPSLLNLIGQRAEDIAEIYANPASSLVDQYQATLLFVGSFERYGTPTCPAAGPYPSVGDFAFPGPGWEEVFSSGDAMIYRRMP